MLTMLLAAAAAAVSAQQPPVTVQQPPVAPQQPPAAAQQPPVPVQQPPVAPQPAPAQPAQPAPAQTRPQATPAQLGTLNMQGASLTAVIDQLARQLRLNYSIDPSIKDGSVTISTYGDPRTLDLRNLLDQILRMNGLGMTEVGGVYRIVPLKELVHQPIRIEREVNGQAIPDDDQPMLNLVFLKYISVEELSKVLQEFAGESAQIMPYPPANLLFILDSRRNLRRTMELISQFDSDTFVNQRVHIFEVHDARPSDLVKELDDILKSISLDSKTSTVKFLPVDRVNELIAVAPNPGVFGTIGEWLKKLDVPVKVTAGDVENYVYRVKYGQAPCLAMALSQLFGNSAQTGGGYGGGYPGAPYGGGYGGGYGGNPFGGGGGYGGGYGGGGYGGYGGGYGGYGGGYGGYGIGGSNPGGYGNATPFMSGFGGANACGNGAGGFGGGYGGGYGGNGGYGYPSFGGYAAQAPNPIGATGQTAGQYSDQRQAQNQPGELGQPGTAGAPPGKRPPRIVPNPLDNALLIQADAQQYQGILKMLQQLDIPPRQILLEAKIYEVDLTDQFASGINSALQQATSPATFLQPTAGITTAGVGTFSVGAMIGSSRLLLATLTLNENRTHVHILSEPSLIATDSIPASINVGTQVPVSTGTTVIPSGGNTVTTQSISSEDTGVTLEVMARVTPGGVVTLYIGQQVSSIDNTINTGTGTPAFDQQVVQTQVTLMDGDTIAIGGTIKDTVQDQVTGIQGLVRIPILGNLFGTKTKLHQRSELIMFMTPHVILDETSLIEASDELKSRVKLLKRFVQGL